MTSDLFDTCSLDPGGLEHDLAKVGVLDIGGQVTDAETGGGHKDLGVLQFLSFHVLHLLPLHGVGFTQVGSILRTGADD